MIGILTLHIACYFLWHKKVIKLISETAATPCWVKESEERQKKQEEDPLENEI